MRGDECIDRSDRKRSFGRQRGSNVVLNAISEGRSIPEKLNSNLVGSRPWPTIRSSSILGQLRRTCTKGSLFASEDGGWA